MPKRMPPSDLDYRSDTDRIAFRIRHTSDPIAAETPKQFYDRTYLLAIAEMGRRRLFGLFHIKLRNRHI